MGSALGTNESKSWCFDDVVVFFVGDITMRHHVFSHRIDYVWFGRGGFQALSNSVQSVVKSRCSTAQTQGCSRWCIPPLQKFRPTHNEWNPGLEPGVEGTQLRLMRSWMDTDNSPPRRRSEKPREEQSPMRRLRNTVGSAVGSAVGGAVGGLLELRARAPVTSHSTRLRRTHK